MDRRGVEDDESMKWNALVRVMTKKNRPERYDQAGEIDDANTPARFTWPSCKLSLIQMESHATGHTEPKLARRWRDYPKLI